MKNRITLIAILVFFVGSYSSTAQETNKVLVKNLQGAYEGDSKNGLANGQGNAKGTDTYVGAFKNGYPNGNGKYIWANGAIYEGEWKMGVRNGKGKYTYTKDGEEKIDDGSWKKDVFVKARQIPPIIIEEKNVNSGTFFNRVGNGNRLTISWMNLESFVEPQELHINVSSGGQFKNGKNVVFQNITFPFTCLISYRSSNSIVTNDCVYNFKIEQAGDWFLTIKN